MAWTNLTLLSFVIGFLLASAFFVPLAINELTGVQSQVNVDNYQSGIVDEGVEFSDSFSSFTGVFSKIVSIAFFQFDNAPIVIDFIYAFLSIYVYISLIAIFVPFVGSGA